MVVGIKNLPANAEAAGDMASIPESGRSPGVGNGNPLHYSCLDNFVDREVCQAAVHGVLMSRIQLSDWQRECRCGDLLLGTRVYRVEG